MGEWFITSNNQLGCDSQIEKHKVSFKYTSEL